MKTNWYDLAASFTVGSAIYKIFIFAPEAHPDNVIFITGLTAMVVAKVIDVINNNN